MLVEKRPEVIVVQGPNGKLPKSKKFEIFSHEIDYTRSFADAKRNLRDDIKQSLERGHGTSLVGFRTCGLVAVAAFSETWSDKEGANNVDEIVTSGTRFAHPDVSYTGSVPTGDRFENDGLKWLEENRKKLSPEQCDRITIVYFKGNIFMSEPEGTLKGASRKDVATGFTSGHLGGPVSVLDYSIDEYFTRQTQLFPKQY